MQLNPAFEDFREPFDAGAPQVVWTRLIADLETPVSAMMKIAAGEPNSFLLESVTGGRVRGRYSFIGLRPDLIWRCKGQQAEVNRNPDANPEAFEPMAEPTLDALRSIVAESRIDLPEGLPPMAAPLVGYLGYDTVRLVERIPDENPDLTGTPDGVFVRPTLLCVFDTIEDTLTLITPVRPSGARATGMATAEDAYETARKRLQRAVEAMEDSLPAPRAADFDDLVLPPPVSNMTENAFKGMVAKAKDYILSGDIFQVVLSQRFRVPFPLPAFSLYRSLRRLNPSPFLFFLDFGGYALVGSSPEILVRVRDGRVAIRPIAGTRPRGKDEAEDKALEVDLLADEKELAEHLMLLDLGRNDVGRVAEIGSVEVTERNVIERYSHVMHIVSNVEGDLDTSKYDAIDALLGGFPAGTVSGAPKVRAMEIIDELEPERRSFYAGCIGYFGADGEMDTCIALRTAMVKDGEMIVQAGAGIVHDSKPDAEFQETLNKAGALLRAAEEAKRFAEDKNS
ncbi:MAG: anthranilate synthase component I [Magnetovibrionaceae bacterium]